MMLPPAETEQPDDTDPDKLDHAQIVIACLIAAMVIVGGSAVWVALN